MDPAGLGADGNLFMCGASETPQYASGLLARSECDSDAGLYNVADSKPSFSISQAPGRAPLYALDRSMLTWGQPADGDGRPWIRIDLKGRFEIVALRLVWKEVGLS